MIDYYKILNLPFGAPEREIKKRFRELATIHHPDKNANSKNSEETFKVILNAYETLSDKDRRAIYDLKYKQQVQQPKPEQTNQNTTSSNSNSKNDLPKQPPLRNRKYQRTKKTKPNVKYSFWIIVVLLTLIYLYNSNKTTTTGSTKADKQFEEQESRPQSGEIDFNK